MQYGEFIKGTVEEVSKIARENFGKVVGTTKEGDNNQVLTETDLEIGRKIIEKIQDHYPDYNIIDEEAGVIDKKSNFTWVVDPIDGTSNFASGVPLYGIMLGLLDGGMPIAGGISLPYFSEIYVAEKGKGAYCNGERIFISQEKKLEKCLVAYQIDGHPENPEITRNECRKLAEIILNIRNLRCSTSVFDFCMFASGKYGAYLSQCGKVWDRVAEHIIASEAGALYTHFDGSLINYVNSQNQTDDTFTVLSASPELHRQLLEIINRSV